MSLRPRLLLVLLALLFFTGPLLLLAAGARPEQFENRTPAPRPSPAMGFSMFDVATRYFTEHLPYRKDAVDANTRIAQDVFGYTPAYGGRADEDGLPFGEPSGADAAAPAVPTRDIFTGKDGWLFLQADLTNACAPERPVGAATGDWRRLADVVAAKGRPTTVLVAPDKATIYPERLPDDEPQLPCHAEGSDELWDGLRDVGPPFVPLLLDAERAAKRARAPLATYKRKDSHWNGLGAVAAVDALVRSLDPAVRVRPADVTVVEGVDYDGDLPKLVGMSGADTTPEATVSRAGAGRPSTTQVRAPHALAARTVRRGATAPMVGGRTLFVHDSFGTYMLPALGPYVRDLTSVLFDDIEPGDLAPLIARADRVIFETVQREFVIRVGPRGKLPPAEIDQIERDVPTRR